MDTTRAAARHDPRSLISPDRAHPPATVHPLPSRPRALANLTPAQRETYELIGLHHLDDDTTVDLTALLNQAITDLGRFKDCVESIRAAAVTACDMELASQMQASVANANTLVATVTAIRQALAP